MSTLPTPATAVLSAIEEFRATVTSAERALRLGDYLGYSAAVTEAVARFSAVHRAYRALVESRNRYTP